MTVELTTEEIVILYTNLREELKLTKKQMVDLQDAYGRLKNDYNILESKFQNLRVEDYQ
jgi:hypothetical protein